MISVENCKIFPPHAFCGPTKGLAVRTQYRHVTDGWTDMDTSQRQRLLYAEHRTGKNGRKGADNMTIVYYRQLKVQLFQAIPRQSTIQERHSAKTVL